LDPSEIQTLDPSEIYRFLGRQRREKSVERLEIHLDTFLKEILSKANEFVPSEAGSILLDDPRVKMGALDVNRLTFIAVFGGYTDKLLGQSIPASKGIAGHVYVSGTPYIAKSVSEDEHFWSIIDKSSGFKTRSMIAVPVIVGESICGVLELLNRKTGGEFSLEDLALLETFAGYISSSIQNALDILRVRELARRDDLTGLYNDRFLHTRLSDEIKRSEQNETDLSVIFLDLDFFKNINDTHGHLIGSQLLTGIGELLETGSPPGAITARYGGDEFVIVLPGFDANQAKRVSESIRRLMQKTSFNMSKDSEIHRKNEKDGGGASIKITCSLGIASLIQHVPPVGSLKQRQNTLLRLADTAMYEAKANGKNKTVISKPEV